MKVELKICERCGVIWLRPLNTSWAYCGGCFPVIRAMVHRSSRRLQKAGAR